MHLRNDVLFFQKIGMVVNAKGVTKTHQFLKAKY